MRKLASIQKVLDIKPIEGADLICAYKVLGWWVVSKVGEFKVGDYVIYISIDSWVPTDIAPFLSKGNEPREYGGVLGEKLRTVKLKGQISQGLILPVNILDHFDLGYMIDNGIFPLKEGTDVTDLLDILKWEPQIPAQLAGQVRGTFPSFISKTDQERIQNLQSAITEEYNKRTIFEVTTKLDGSSCTVYYNNDDLGVCSRNQSLKLDQEGNTFVDVAKSTGLLNALQTYGKNIAVQGELMGPGIQGNREKLTKHDLFIFDIYDIDNGRYYTPKSRDDIVERLRDFGYTGSVVPVISLAMTLPTDDIDKLLKFAEGPSLNHPIREGLVFKRNDGEFSFKIINNQFLLKEK